MTAQEALKTAHRPLFPLAGAAVGILLAGYLALVIGFAWNPTPLAQALAATGIVAACVHAALFYGWRDALAIFAICVVITFVMENTGSLTGFPFGRYHFEVGADLPHIGVIPVIVGPLWFGMGYFSWILAGTLLGAPVRPASKFEALAWPIVAAFVMTQWDVVMDPPASTISKAWIWHDGGVHFGVPLSNYAGWLLTSWLFFQAFAIYLSRRSDLSEPPAARTKVLRLTAIALYLSSGLTHLTPWLIGQGGEVIDAAGHLWRIADLRATTALTMLATMLVSSMLAVLRLAADRT